MNLKRKTVVMTDKCWFCYPVGKYTLKNNGSGVCASCHCSLQGLLDFLHGNIKSP